MAGSLRIPGVLQRIALCYLAGSLIFLGTRVRGQVIAVVGLLVGYWLLMTRVPVPEFGPGDLARGHDLGSYLDRLLLPGHIYKADYDPEGLLSTLPAIATTLLGILTGQWLRTGRPGYELDAGLFLGGAACMAAGWAWSQTFPINKALWTGPFVLLTGGLAMTGLAACYWLVDLRGYRRWAGPFRVFGANAIAAYTLAAIGARLMSLPLIARSGGKPTNVHALIHDEYLLQALSPLDASLAYAALFVLACFLVILALDALGIPHPGLRHRDRGPPPRSGLPTSGQPELASPAGSRASRCSPLPWPLDSPGSGSGLGSGSGSGAGSGASAVGSRPPNEVGMSPKLENESPPPKLENESPPPKLEDESPPPKLEEEPSPDVSPASSSPRDGDLGTTGPST